MTPYWKDQIGLNKCSPYAGTNCGSTDGKAHSAECLAEHDAVVNALRPDEQAQGEVSTGSVFLANLHYFFGQTDGTFAWPKGSVGDLLRQAKREIEATPPAAQQAEQPKGGETGQQPIPMVLHCPTCGMQHIDEPEWINVGPDERGRRGAAAIVWDNPPHRSHLCHGCGTIWRPADVPTTGVERITTKGKADNWEPGAPPAQERGALVPMTDTDRIDWLQEHDGRFYNIDCISSIVGIGFMEAGLPHVKHASLRDAIDAAIRQRRAGGETHAAPVLRRPDQTC